MGGKKGGGSVRSGLKEITYEPSARFQPKQLSKEDFARKFVSVFGSKLPHQTKQPQKQSQNHQNGLTMDRPKTRKETFEEQERLQAKKKNKASIPLPPLPKSQSNLFISKFGTSPRDELSKIEAEKKRIQQEKQKTSLPGMNLSLGYKPQGKEYPLTTIQQETSKKREFVRAQKQGF